MRLCRLNPDQLRILEGPRRLFLRHRLESVRQKNSLIHEDTICHLLTNAVSTIKEGQGLNGPASCSLGEVEICSDRSFFCKILKELVKRERLRKGTPFGEWRSSDGSW